MTDVTTLLAGIKARRAAAAYAIRDTLVTRNAWDMADAALAAANAHDAAHGIHRVSLDDATVERAARRIFADSGTGKADEWVYMAPEDERRIYFMNIARRALAAAVEAGQ